MTATKKRAPKKPSAAGAMAVANPSSQVVDVALARNTLRVIGDKDKAEQVKAELAVEGVVTNAALTRTFGAPLTGEIGITEALHSLRSTIGEVNSGDLHAAEAMLMAQAVALNAVFGEMARRSHQNMGDYLDATDRYLRLALKAQNQCRATLETLAMMKNPPVVFARQANFANGPQQVNNSIQQPPHAPALQNNSGPTEQSYGGMHAKTLDTRAAGTTGRADPQLETLGEVNRPAHSRRKGTKPE